MQELAAGSTSKKPLQDAPQGSPLVESLQESTSRQHLQEAPAGSICRKHFQEALPICTSRLKWSLLVCFAGVMLVDVDVVVVFVVDFAPLSVAVAI